MRVQTDKKLEEFQIRAGEARRKALLRLVPTVVVAVLLALIAVFLPQFGAFAGVAAYLSLAFLLILLPRCVRPLSREKRAYCQLVEAARLIEKGDSAVFYSKAFDHTHKAHKLLKRVVLDDFAFYDSTNTEFKRLTKNIKELALSALYTNKLSSAELEDIALSIVSPSAMRAINERLEERYTEVTIPESGLKTSLASIRKNKAANIFFSLALGYGMIIVICLVYTTLVEENLLTFARNNPELIILGGAAFSGISFLGGK